MKPLLLTLLVTTQLAMGDAARDARWQHDLQYLATQLPQVHPNFYSLVPAAQFNQAVSSLANAIPTLSDAQVEVGLARIVAMPGVLHTALYLTQINSSFHILPLSMQWFDDGLYVIAAAPAYARALGAKIVQIGSMTTDDAYGAVTPIISHENDIWVRGFSPNYLQNADILEALGIAASNTSVPFVFQDLTGTQFGLDIGALDPGAPTGTITALPSGATGFVPLYQRNRSQNYWYTYVGSSGLLYFAYNSCENMPSLSFADFNNQFWAFFDSQPAVRMMVIDLRNNGGGDSSVLNPFFISGQQRQARFAGIQTYAIIGRSTASSAVLNAITLQQGGVELIGEPTGGSPNSYGEVATLVLPNSQLTVDYATSYFSYPEYPVGPLLPDVSVPMGSADYFARHDRFLAAALAGGLPNSNAASTAGTVAVVNAATYRVDLPVAAGSLAAAFGDFTGAAAANAQGLPLPKSLGGIQLLVNGTAAPLVAVLPNQINFQVPANTDTGTATFQVMSSGPTLQSGTAVIATTSPGLFLSNLADTDRPIAALDQNSAPIGAAGVNAGSVIQIFGTGQGAASPAIADGTAGAAQTLVQPQIFFGTEQAQIVYSGFPGDFPGLWQANVIVPVSAAVSGQVPLFVAIGGAASNGVTVQVNP